MYTHVNICATLLGPLVQFLVYKNIYLDSYMAASQCMYKCKHGHDHLLKFKMSIRMGKKGDQVTLKVRYWTLLYMKHVTNVLFLYQLENLKFPHLQKFLAVCNHQQRLAIPPMASRWSAVLADAVPSSVLK